MPIYPGSPFVWDAAARRYRWKATGQFLSRGAVRQAVDQVIAGLGAEARGLATALRAGRLSLTEFQTEMRALVKTAHLLNASAAVGGWDAMTPADWGRAGQRIREQYGYVDRFVQDITSGTQRLDGTLDLRAKMYADAGRGTYESVVRTIEQDGGATEERSVLHPADHCGDCVAMYALGWQPIGSLIPIGDRQCLTNCKCTMDYR